MTTTTGDRIVTTKGAKMLRFRLWAGVAVALLLGFHSAASAQPSAWTDGETEPSSTPWPEPTSTPSPVDQAPVPTATVCGIGRPGQRCASIILVELGGRSGTVDYTAFDFGLLVNRGEHEAFGATIGMIGTGTAGKAGWAVKARYRRWLVDYVGLDFGVGGGQIPNATSEDLEGVVEVALELGDVIAVTAGANTYHGPDGRDREVGVNVGFRLGGPALLVIAEVLSLARR